MTRRTISVLPFVAVLTATVMSCGEESVPVAVTPAPPPAVVSVPQIDQALVGVWYRAGYMNGYAFNRPGSWYPLRVVDGELAWDYGDDGGPFTTPRPGECVFEWTDYTVHEAFPRSATYTYAFSRNDSVLTLRAATPGPDSVRVFVRASVGDPVPSL